MPVPVGVIRIVSLVCLLSACGSPSNSASVDPGDNSVPLAIAKLAADGDAGAQNALGIQYYLGIGRARDLKLATLWFEKAALQGNSSAQLNLGLSYLYGYGISRDSARAFGWFQAASTAGNSHAEPYLALLTDNLTGMQMRRARDAVAEQLNQSLKQ